MAGAEPPEQPLVFLALVEVIAGIGIGLAILGIGRLAPSLGVRNHPRHPEDVADTRDDDGPERAHAELERTGGRRHG